MFKTNRKNVNTKIDISLLPKTKVIKYRDDENNGYDFQDKRQTSEVLINTASFCIEVIADDRSHYPEIHSSSS